jgi:hypothetical protein
MRCFTQEEGKEEEEEEELRLYVSADTSNERDDLKRQVLALDTHIKRGHGFQNEN